MFKILVMITLVFCIGLAGDVFAQDVSQRTRELIAALDKTKYKKKEKRDIKIELYVDIRNEAVVKSDPVEYSGLYESLESMARLNIRVAQDGSATGSGYDFEVTGDDDSAKMAFVLKDARVDGALLSATKIYSNGHEEKLDAVFTNRTVSNGTNPSNIETTSTTFGIGYVQTRDNWTNRVFLEFRR